jgi:ankyrin repeat protein
MFRSNRRWWVVETETQCWGPDWKTWGGHDAQTIIETGSADQEDKMTVVSPILRKYGTQQQATCDPKAGKRIGLQWRRALLQYDEKEGVYPFVLRPPEEAHMQGLDALVEHAETHVNKKNYPMEGEIEDQVSEMVGILGHAVNLANTNMLFAACRFGEPDVAIATLRYISESKTFADDAQEIINSYNADGDTCLHVAARNDHPQLVRILCDVQASVTKLDADGNTPLHISSSKGSDRCLEYMLRTLETTGTPEGSATLSSSQSHVVNEDALQVRGFRDRTPLHLASTMVVVNRLIQHSKKQLRANHRHQKTVVSTDEFKDQLSTFLDAEDMFGITPLSSACAHGRADVVAALIGAGAQHSKQTWKGGYAPVLAALIFLAELVLTEFVLTALIFLTEIPRTVSILLTELALTVPILLTELALFVLIFLTQLDLTVPILLSEVALTVLIFLTELVLTVLISCRTRSYCTDIFY